MTGTWQPDGRTTDPDSVPFSDPRTAALESFQGLDANGSWTLFFADLSSGGQHQLESWGLEITAVPEPAAGGLAAILVVALASFLEWRRGRR